MSFYAVVFISFNCPWWAPKAAGFALSQVGVCSVKPVVMLYDPARRTQAVRSFDNAVMEHRQDVGLWKCRTTEKEADCKDLVKWKTVAEIQEDSK